MPSTKPPDEEPFFLVDRTFGERIAEALRELGFGAQTLADLYGPKPSEKVADPTWIARAAKEGWIGLTKDELRPWKGTIVREHARIVRIGRAAKTTAFQKAWLDTNQHRIRARCAKPGPWFYVVREKTLEPVALPAEVW